VLLAAVILSFYGGGFATVPAYLKDMFGTFQVGAIHGRLLTAWSAAGVAGPLIVNVLTGSQRDAGLSGAAAYRLSLLVMVALLVVGFIANLLVTPVSERYHEQTGNEDDRSMATAGIGGPTSAPAAALGRPRPTGRVRDELADQPQARHRRRRRTRSDGGAAPSGGLAARIAVAWTIVGVPLAYGIYETAKKAAALFTG
jgi:hypothetical protein